MMQPVKSGIKIIGYTDEFAGKIKVYDDRRKQIGEITKFGTKYTAKDMHLKVIATYEERYNETKDDSGRKIGRGNMLVEALLKNSFTGATKTSSSSFGSDLSVQKNLSGRKPVKDRYSKTIGYIDDSRSKIIVYNDSNRQLGEIIKEGSKLIAKDSRFRKIAEYDERMNETKDASGRKLGRGNMLVEILLKNG